VAPQLVEEETAVWRQGIAQLGKKSVGLTAATRPTVEARTTAENFILAVGGCWVVWNYGIV
jgi:hypothetical protein